LHERTGKPQSRPMPSEHRVRGQALQKQHDPTRTMPRILNKIQIFNDRHSYVYRDGSTVSQRWYLYFYDKERKTCHRFSLGDDFDFSSEKEALRRGEEKYLELRTKSERGEKIKLLTAQQMAERFRTIERNRISPTPHTGITKVRHRFISNHLDKFLEYVRPNTPVHKFGRDIFSNYIAWRRDWAELRGKPIPRDNTIRQELSTFRRMIRTIAMQEGYLTAMPTLPTLNTTRQDRENRRDCLTREEWKRLEVKARNWAKQTHKKEIAAANYREGIKKVVVSAKIRPTQQKHRKLMYLAMMITMNTGIRIGSLRKLKWANIEKNPVLSSDQQKISCLIRVPGAITKTGISYTINAPIVDYLNQIREITNFKRPSDFIFMNQKLGQPFSDRIWKDSFHEMLVESGIAVWAKNDNNHCRKVTVLSGKKLTWYSLRHTYITFRILYGKTSIATLCNQTNTSMKYMDTHYFHYRAELSTEELNEGRKYLRETNMDIDWMDRNGWGDVRGDE